jgi:cytochrome c peroxidase
MAFHAIAMPQIGPGKGDGVDGHDDFGRFRESLDVNDMFAFRTPLLRNVALTAPYGHAGAYNTLEDVVRHHLDPVEALWQYHESRHCHTIPVMPHREDLSALDCVVMDDALRVQAIADAASDYVPIVLSDTEIQYLVSFLHALTDKGSIDLRADVPRSVPSGLTLAD